MRVRSLRGVSGYVDNANGLRLHYSVRFPNPVLHLHYRIERRPATET